MIQWIYNVDAPILSLDIPSGIDPTTGNTPGVYVKAIQTMTLALPKVGLQNLSAGELILTDIGIPKKTFTQASIKYENLFGNNYRILLKRCSKKE